MATVEEVKHVRRGPTVVVYNAYTGFDHPYRTCDPLDAVLWCVPLLLLR